jgi:purine catabolism regulator
MTVRVADVLELDVLRQADAAVLAGAAGLKRAVRWVHVSELPDIAYLLNGGELLLTTGMGIASSSDAQRRFVRELVEAGCAGLVIELLRSFTELPAALTSESDRCGLPLIGLRREARFVDITERVHVAIINEQYAQLVRADAVSREFTTIAMRGSGARPVLDRLARIVENPVVLEDGAHQVVGYATNGLGVGELLEAWARHSRIGHRGHEPGVHRVPGDPECAWAPVVLHEQPWGRLHMIELGRAIDEGDRLALERAAAAVAMALLSERHGASMADQGRRALISDLLRGRYASRAEVIHRARSLGAELEGTELAALVLGFADSAHRPGAGVVGEGERRLLARVALEETRDAIRGHGLPGVASIDEGQVVALLGLPPDGTGGPRLEQVASAACDGCRRRELATVAVAGVSHEGGQGSLPRLFDQADEALRYGIRSGSGGVYQYSDLGIHHLLVRLNDGPELAAFVESQLQPLFEHEARGAASLLPTLRVYLATGGNKAAAARLLFIERRTLYRRLERIQELLGVEESDHQRWLCLAVAVQGFDVLRERSPLHGRHVL